MDPLKNNVVVVFDVPGMKSVDDISVTSKEAGLPAVIINGFREPSRAGKGYQLEYAAGAGNSPKVEFGEFQIEVPLHDLQINTSGKKKVEYVNGCLELTIPKITMPKRFGKGVKPANQASSAQQVSEGEATDETESETEPPQVVVKAPEVKESKTEYDIIFDISDLTTFTRTTRKWDVVVSKNLMMTDPKTQKPVPIPIQTIFNKGLQTMGKVAVSGLYNRGKTFVLNLLAGLQMDSNENNRTKGVSIKNPVATNLKGQISFIDSAGQYVPVVSSDPASWDDRIATEGLIKQILLDVANIHIVVVNELTWPDQLYISEVQQMIRGRPVSQEVIVIHNLRTMDYKQMLLHRTTNVKKYYEDAVEMPILSSKDTSVKWLSSPQSLIRHVFLINHETDEGKKHNLTMIAEVRQWLLVYMSAYSASNIVKEVADSIARNLRSYLWRKRNGNEDSDDEKDIPKVVAKLEGSGNDQKIVLALLGNEEFLVKHVPLPTAFVTGIHAADKGTHVPAHMLYESEKPAPPPPVDSAKAEEKSQTGVSATGDSTGGGDALTRTKELGKERSSEYDLILDITDLDDLIAKGWNIEVNNGLDGTKLFGEPVFDTVKLSEKEAKILNDKAQIVANAKAVLAAEAAEAAALAAEAAKSPKKTGAAATAAAAPTPAKPEEKKKSTATGTIKPREFKEKDYVDSGVHPGGWWQRGKVAVSGLFNRGKTFVLNRLGGVTLQSAVDYKTKGISFKNPTESRLKDKCLLIDTAGQNVPVSAAPDGAVSNWANRLGTESLIKKMVFDIANLHIIVVNELTWPDQLYIKEVSSIVKQAGDRVVQEVFVVHNLKGLKLSQLPHFSANLMKLFYPAAKAVPIQNRPVGSTVDYVFYADTRVGVKHFFLVNDKEKDGKAYNDCMFLELTGFVNTHCAARPVTNVIAEVQSAFDKYIPECIVHKQDETVKPLVSLDWTPGSFFSKATGVVKLLSSKHDGPKVRNVSIPRNLVTGIQSPLEQTPPHIVYNPSKSHPNELTIVVDLPGVLKDNLNIDHEPNGSNMDLIIKARRDPAFKGVGRTLTPSMGGNSLAIPLGNIAITIPLAPALRIDFDSFDPENGSMKLENGCLTLTYVSNIPPDKNEVEEDPILAQRRARSLAARAAVVAEGEQKKETSDDEGPGHEGQRH